MELQAMFQSKLPFRTKDTSTLVIHCNDSRYQIHFDNFIISGLGLEPGEFNPIVVPGGYQFMLSTVNFLPPKFEWVGKRWIKFILKHENIREIICIGHEDCLWYKEIAIGHFTIDWLKKRQLEDLKKVKRALAELSPDISVRTFYAYPDEAQMVSFAEIT